MIEKENLIILRYDSPIHYKQKTSNSYSSFNFPDLKNKSLLVKLCRSNFNYYSSVFFKSLIPYSKHYNVFTNVIKKIIFLRNFIKFIRNPDVF